MKSTTLVIIDFADLAASPDAVIYQRMDSYCMSIKGLKLPRYNARGISRSQDLITVHLCVVQEGSQDVKEVGRISFAPVPDFGHRPLML